MATTAFQKNFGTWDQHMDRLTRSENLSPQDQAEVLRGLAKLRETFDDDWLWETASEGFRHPLTGKLFNYAPWSQLWIAQFGNKLAYVSQLAGFNKIEGRLKSVTEYPGAEREVLTASRFQGTGLEVELQPNVEGGKSDIRTWIGGQDFYIEVTSLGTPLEEKKASDTLWQLAPPPGDPDVLVACQIHRALSKPRIKEFRLAFEQAVNQVKETKAHCHISEPGVLDYLVAHKDKSVEFEVLLEKYGMEHSISGPPYETDDIRRLKRTISVKAKKKSQLPKGKPGLLVIFANLYRWDDKKPYDDLVGQIEETVYDEDHLVAAVMVMGAGEFGARDETINKSHFTLVRKVFHDFWQETTLVIKNRYAHYQNVENMDKLFAVFTH